MDQKELLNDLKHNELFTKEMKDILLELDTTNSMSTQAYLNDLLLLVRERLQHGEHIIDEAAKQELTLTSFEDWIRKEFTSYSSDMYFDSIKHNK